MHYLHYKIVRAILARYHYRDQAALWPLLPLMDPSMAKAPFSSLPGVPQFEPNTEAIKRKLLQKGVHPTPKILHNLRKKQIQKHSRKLNKISQTEPLTPSQKQALQEESHFQTLKREYRQFTRAVREGADSGALLVGKPWERIERVNWREIASGSKEEAFNGGKLNRESLKDLKEIFKGNLKWVFLDDDVEVENCGDWSRNDDQHRWEKRRGSQKEAIRFLVERLSCREVSLRDWKLARIMKQSGLRFSEEQLLRILEGLGKKGRWAQAMAVVDWVYNNKDLRHDKSRFVYTKLLSVLGRTRRPQEALHIFNLMREDCNMYPDMAAYHTIAVALGQAGLLKELLSIAECMRQRTYNRVGNMRHRNWHPVFEPDLVIYNAILNACIPSKQWKGVPWVFKQLRKSGLKPNGASYGLAMEVMLSAGKYDFVHELFRKMNSSEQTPKALTYKVLVRAFWEDGKVNEAVEALRDMEQRGVVGSASVYYELACCLCKDGRWQDAMPLVKKIKNLRHRKPLEVTFTGLILSSMDAGYVNHCIAIFEHMKAHCTPNIGTINTMLKVYGQNDLFSEAKELFEDIKKADVDGAHLIPDEYTYGAMLEASASALQWEYFEYVYKEMVSSGYRLDQSKHACQLLDAARAGKVHLLNHAFDAILGAGEIPCLKIFTEMVYQVILQQDYERAAILVNSMAHTPYEVGERQWINLYKKNGIKIGRESIERLLEVFGGRDMGSDINITNFLKSLEFLCRYGGASEESSSSGACIVEDAKHSYPQDKNNGKGDSAIRMDGRTEVDKDPFDAEVDVTTNKPNFPRSYTCVEGDCDSDMVRGQQINASETCIMTNLSNMDSCIADVTHDEAADCLDNELSDFTFHGLSTEDDEWPFEVPININDDGSRASNLPSAYEILEAWKESSKSDGRYTLSLPAWGSASSSSFSG